MEFACSYQVFCDGNACIHCMSVLARSLPKLCWHTAAGCCCWHAAGRQRTRTRHTAHGTACWRQLHNRIGGRSRARARDRARQQPRSDGNLLQAAPARTCTPASSSPRSSTSDREEAASPPASSCTLQTPPPSSTAATTPACQLHAPAAAGCRSHTGAPACRWWCGTPAATGAGAGGTIGALASVLAQRRNAARARALR